jgi:stringent starvation protein B
MNKLLLFITFLLGTLLLRSQTPTASFSNWKDNNKAAYTIIHDDFSSAVSGIYAHADPIATPLGIKFCFGAITHPDQCGPTEWAKARAMVSHGHECINHSHTHRCGGSASACSGQLTYGVSEYGVELGQSSTIIQTETGVKPLFFIHPYDAPSTAIETYLTGIGYLGARGGTQATYNASNFTDFMHLNYYVYAPGTAISTLDQAVSTTIAAGGYAIREFHGIDDASWGVMTRTNYENHLNFVKAQMDAKNLWSATASEVITYKMQRDAYQPSATYSVGSGQVNVNFTNVQTINTSVLKTPVTVNVDLKTISTTNLYTVSQNGNAVAFTRNANIITFNVYPHQGNVILNCTNCALAAPSVGTITQPTCALATGSVVLRNLPSGNWTINPGAITGSGTSKTVTGLVQGTYNFTVTNSANTVSPPSANVVINAQPTAPTAPSVGTTTQPTCTVATGSVVLNGLPATGNWTINPGNITGSGVSYTRTGLTTGTYNFTVTNATGCTSLASANVVINTAPTVPTAPIVGTITQPSCAVPLGSVVLNGLPATGNWTINPGGFSGSGVTRTITDLATGTYNFTVTNASNCISPASANVVINTLVSAPSVSASTVTQPTCSVSTGTIVVNATGTGTLEYSLNGGTYQSSATFSGLSAGVYTISVRTVGSSCVASGSSVTITGVANAPSVSASTVTQPTCSVSTGTIVVNATGTGTLEYSLNGGTYQSSATFGGLSAGVYTISVRIVGSSCVASGSSVTITGVASAPTVSASTVTQPTCSVSTGTIVVNATGTGTLEYSLNGGAYQSSATFSGLSVGVYTISVRTVGSTCVASGSSVTITGVTGAPTVSASTVTQPTCSVSTGTIVVNATGTGTLEYRLNGGVYQTSATFSGLSVGSYIISVRLVGSTCSTTGSTVVITAATGCCSTTIPPTITLTSPVNGGVTASNLNFAATASDADGTISTVNFYWVTGITKTGVVTRTLLGSDNTAPYTFTWTNIPGGNYNVQAEAVDNCGAATFSTISNVIILETMSVIVTSPLSGQGFFVGQNITIASSVINYSSRSISKVEFFVNGVKIGEDLTAPYTMLWPNVPAGNYSISTKATDNIGGVWSSPTYLITFYGTFSRPANESIQSSYRELSFSTYPNPAKNEVVLNTDIVQSGDYNVTITDLMGRLLWTQKSSYMKGKNTDILDISKMSKGIYLINLKQIEGGQSVVQKLIVD